MIKLRIKGILIDIYMKDFYNFLEAMVHGSNLNIVDVATAKHQIQLIDQDGRRWPVDRLVSADQSNPDNRGRVWIAYINKKPTPVQFSSPEIIKKYWQLHKAIGQARQQWDAMNQPGNSATLGSNRTRLG